MSDESQPVGRDPLSQVSVETSRLPCLPGILEQQSLDWESGQGVFVEQILAEHSDLTGQVNAILDLIQNEIFCRKLRHDTLQLSEYQTRFPELQREIEIQWQLDELLFGDLPIGSHTTQIAETDGQNANDLPFETLGAYKILEVVGQGGMGIVFRAEHQLLAKTVALKILPRHLTERPSAVARFHREMRAIGVLEHPNLVQAFDAGEVEGIRYIAMEYVAGLDLHKLVKTNGPLAEQVACAIVRQVSDGLAAAHAAGIVHRDIKPSNVMISHSGQVKLLDLGLARLVDEEGDSTDLTSLAHTIGTPDYMAPEQWDSVNSVGQLTDLYAVGCLFYFLLVGYPPYGSPQYSTPSRKMKGHLLDPIPDPRVVRPDVSEDVVQICRTLMAKDPHDRFASAQLLLEALAPFANGDILASVVADALASPPSDSCTTARRTTEPERRQRLSKFLLRWSLAVGTGILITFLIVKQSLVATQEQSSESGPPRSLAVNSRPPGRPIDHSAIDSIDASAVTVPASSESPMDLALGKQLWKLVTPKVVSDGRFEDVHVHGMSIDLNASGASRQLWLDFKTRTGQTMSGRLSLKILNPDKNGFFKIVLLPRLQGAEEYYAIIRRDDSGALAGIASNRGGTERLIATQQCMLNKDSTLIEIRFGADQLEFQLGQEVPMRISRPSRPPGTVAIAVRGWHVELERPTVGVE